MINVLLEQKKLLIQNNIKQHKIQSERYVKERYGVSEAVFCPRKNYFIRAKGDIPEPNGKMITGTLFHTMIPVALKDYPGITNPKFEQECRLDITDEFGTYSIIGHSDVLCDEKVLEFKFTKLYKRKPVSEYYFYQANMYCYLQNRQEYEIITIDKDDLAVEIYSSNRDEDKYKEILENVKLTWQGLNKGIPPEKGPMYDWECNYCPYQSDCRKERTEVVMRKTGLI